MAPSSLPPSPAWSNPVKRLSVLRHLKDLTARTEPTRFTGPPSGDRSGSGRCRYFFSFGNIMFITFFSAGLIHRGVASAATAATEKTATDRRTSPLPQQLTDTRHPVSGVAFQNKGGVISEPWRQKTDQRVLYMPCVSHCTHTIHNKIIIIIITVVFVVVVICK